MKPSDALRVGGGYESFADLVAVLVMPWRWVGAMNLSQVLSLYMPSGAILAPGAGSAIFGLLRRFPIEWCKSRLCACLLVRLSF